jgi:hypothetical protein
MLKLNYEAMPRPHIRNVLLPRSIIKLNDLLEFSREMAFPFSVPLGFFFGPGVTVLDSPMRPMKNPVGATLGEDLTTTNGAYTFPIRKSFKTLISY